ncbi:type Z 30S ribosomal protein S14 [Candidatus Peregrinibacteria bacterium CG10_big_fil_rev_8_21_14_0_10_49_16]|nr:MAG: type Z 30S ribosomal protein S14 [Candidatus Peregrinibacteria bacterium CG22_combo_CG10-13_8_21_14_all_49_11]PIR51836.1 MAG: type Z 30S ribosomal protein S14 [Candidatus Peregrinibacteria bacterium CG10_big_fil_rev_8_21_14_0_10_49_16]
MARRSIVISQQRKLQKLLRDKQHGRKSRFATRAYNRCQLCGRRHGYMRFFGTCRICFRELASNGEIPGITKSSW